MESRATAKWSRGLKDGKGTISVASGVLHDVLYTYATRFENTKGLTPEELIAASHAGCFSMALSAELGKSQIIPELIETTSVVILERQDQGFAVTESRLTSTVTARGADRNAIEAAAAGAKENCPISKLLNAKISLSLTVNT